MIQTFIENLVKRPGAKLFILFLLGLILGHYTELPITFIFIGLCVLTLISIFVSVLKRTENLITQSLFYSIVVIAGILHFEFFSHPLDEKHISNYRFVLKEEIQIEGIICKAPESYEDKSIIIIDAKSIFLNDESENISGRIMVYLHRIATEFQYGDKVQCTGNLRFPRGERNPGGFNHKKYLRAREIDAMMHVRGLENCVILSHGHGNWLFSQVIYPIKSYLSEYLDNSADDVTANFLKGFILGDREQIDPKIIDALSKTGVSHILAVSGLHVGFILLIFWIIFNLLRIPQSCIRCLVIIALILYACVTDLKPPVVRATIMACIFILGPLLQKRSDPFNSLAIAGLAILLFNPADLFEVGFQLSFSAVFSIIYFYPIFVKRIQAIKKFQPFYKKAPIRYVIDLLILSISVQLGTLPLIIFYFGLIPILAIFLNLIIIPAVGLILGLAFASFIFNLFWATLAELYVLVNVYLIHTLVQFVQVVSELPGAYFSVLQPDIVWISISYLALILIVHVDRKKRHKFSLILILLIVNFAIWKSAVSSAPVLKVIFFDVGQGDAALISFPHGEHLLIDGGLRNYQYDTGEKVIAPYLKRHGIERLDQIVVTHAHADHIGGVPYLLKHFEIGRVLDNGCWDDSKLYQQYRHLIDSLQIPHQIIRAGDQLNDIPGIDVLFYHPSTYFLENQKDEQSYENNSSVVVKVIYGKTNFIFTGDIERGVENHLWRYHDLLKSDVLKIPHHGSITSSSPEFLNYVRPQYAVISVGEFNRFNQPSDVILNRLRQFETKTIRTDRNGAVIFESNGEVVTRIR